jgi:aspartate aminotransferase-like enzyme
LSEKTIGLLIENFVNYLKHQKGYSHNTLRAYTVDLRDFFSFLLDKCGFSEKDGIENRWQRHIENAEYTQNCVQDKGQSLFPEDGFESETITCIQNDVGWDINKINDYYDYYV